MKAKAESRNQKPETRGSAFSLLGFRFQLFL
jgi:hypothetical protein